MKIALSAIILGILFFLLISLPLVPQVYPMKVISEDGGYISKSYKAVSLKHIYSNLKSSFKYFPHNKDSRRYNQVSLSIATAISALIFGTSAYFIRRKLWQ